MTDTPDGPPAESVDPFAPPAATPLPPYTAPPGWQPPPTAGAPTYGAPPGWQPPPPQQPQYPYGAPLAGGQPQVPPVPGPYIQPPGYGGGYGYYPPQAGTNGFAIAALVCSIVLAVVCIGSILGIVFGIIGLRQCAERGQSGRGLAIAGIVIGGIAIVLWIVLIIVGTVAGHSSSPDNSGFGATLLAR